MDRTERHEVNTHTPARRAKKSPARESNAKPGKTRNTMRIISQPVSTAQKKNTPLPQDRATLEQEISRAGSRIKGNDCNCPHPDHDDGKASASIHEGKGGAWRVTCHSRGCFGKGADVYDLRAVLTGRPLDDVLRDARSDTTTPPPPPPAKQPPKPRKTYPTPEAAANAPLYRMNRDGKVWRLTDRWDYRDAEGKLYAAVQRYDTEGDKSYRPLTAEGDKWTIGDPASWQPYRVDELPDDGPVWIVEGEKAADALWSVGIPATTTAHGAGSADKTDLSLLDGRDVYIWPDKDDAGRAYAEAVAEMLNDSHVRIITPPDDLPHKGDAHDFTEQRDAQLPEDIAASISELVEQAEVYMPAAGPIETPPAKQATRPSLRNITLEDTGKKDDKGKPIYRFITRTPGEVCREVFKKAGPVYTLGDDGPLWTPTPDRPDCPARIIDDVPGLFAWLKERCAVKWYNGIAEGGDVLGKQELQKAIKSKPAGVYDIVMTLPHSPPMRRTYYALPTMPEATGRHLAEFIDNLNPETDADRDLLKAMTMTPGWGGPCGARPMFFMTSDHGRGAGKTKTAEAIGLIWRGTLTVSLETREGIERMRQRLLAPSNVSRRAVCLDNVKGSVASGEIESLITADIIDGHRMFYGDGRRPNNLTWVMTANGVGLSRDLADRAVVIKLGKPKPGDFVSWAQNYIERYRLEIVADIMAELEADKPGRVSDGNRDRWAAWQDAVLSCMPNADALAALIKERRGGMDQDAEEWAEVKHEIEQLLAAVHYSPNVPTFIPSKVLCDRIEVATGQRLTGRGLATMLSRFTGVGDSGRLEKNPSNKHGRGYIWRPAEGDQVSPELSYPNWDGFNVTAMARL